jgi:hypothetical protein
MNSTQDDQQCRRPTLPCGGSPFGHPPYAGYLDFTPVMIVGGACIIGSRYLAIGLGDTTLYIMAGMAAALFLSLRLFLFRGAGKAN